MIIDHPLLGPRDAAEFVYLGDAALIDRPDWQADDAMEKFHSYGYLRDNPQYAATLNRVALEGPGAFYSGEIAEDIVERTARPPMAGSMTLDDLAGYEPVTREAVCGAWRKFRVCSAPPPSSGVAQVMILDLYDRFAGDGESTSRLAAFVDAQRLAYADRDLYVADPGYVDVPVATLIDPAYLERRAAARAAPGEAAGPGDAGGSLPGGGDGAEQPGTSHLSIVDAEGNAVSLTASVGAPFGSLRMTNGFLLNNEMSDFSRAPEEGGVPAANRVEPGKRPRSSMSPTMVFDATGELRMVTGSPGGNSIVAYVSKSILGVLDWDLSAQEAADYPNIIARGDTVRVETADETGETIASTLESAGYPVSESDGENSGLHVIVVHPGRLEGAADSRRDGAVAAIPQKEP